MLLIILAITSSLSQNFSEAWHGNAKTLDETEIKFVFLLEKKQKICNTEMAIPTSGLVGLIPKSTTLKEGKLTIEDSISGMKHESIWNKSTNQIKGT